MASNAQEAAVERFTEACRADARVVAAFVGGSHAAGTADLHSDVDLYLITADGAYDSFFAGRRSFLRRVGEPVLEEDFSGFGFDMVIFILADGVKGELGLARESRFTHIHGGPFRVLLDRKGILAGVDFPWQRPAEDEQVEALRRLMHGFWRDLSLFTSAMARGRRWTAHGYLESLRLRAVNLARLAHEFGADAGGYEKLEQAVAAEALAPLERTFCPLERAAMEEAAALLIGHYRRVVPALGEEHGVAYPAEIDRVVAGRFEALRQERGGLRAGG
jgi:hypothetical protein